MTGTSPPIEATAADATGLGDPARPVSLHTLAPRTPAAKVGGSLTFGGRLGAFRVTTMENSSGKTSHLTKILDAGKLMACGAAAESCRPRAPWTRATRIPRAAPSGGTASARMSRGRRSASGRSQRLRQGPRRPRRTLAGPSQEPHGRCHDRPRPTAPGAAHDLPRPRTTRHGAGSAGHKKGPVLALAPGARSPRGDRLTRGVPGAPS